MISDTLPQGQGHSLFTNTVSSTSINFEQTKICAIPSYLYTHDMKNLHKIRQQASSLAKGTKSSSNKFKVDLVHLAGKDGH